MLTLLLNAACFLKIRKSGSALSHLVAMDERIPQFLDTNPNDRLYHHDPLQDKDSFRLVDL